MQLTLTAQCICSAGTRRSGLFVAGRIDVSLDMTRTLRQAARCEAHVRKGEHATGSSRGCCYIALLLLEVMLGSTAVSMLQLTLTLTLTLLVGVESETTLCLPSLEILSYRRQITSHLRKQGTLSHQSPTPSASALLGCTHQRQGIVINAPASRRRLHGLGEQSSAADIHLGSRPIGLCSLYWQSMH